MRPNSLAKVARLHPGRRFEQATALEEERAGAPPTLVELLGLLGPAPPLPEAVRQLIDWGEKVGRPVLEREARAAVLVALALEWARA